MAIIIPSESIYNLDNKKVLDNKINKVSGNLKSQSSSIDGELVFTHLFNIYKMNESNEYVQGFTQEEIDEYAIQVLVDEESSETSYVYYQYASLTISVDYSEKLFYFYNGKSITNLKSYNGYYTSSTTQKGTEEVVSAFRITNKIYDTVNNKINFTVIMPMYMRFQEVLEGVLTSGSMYWLTSNASIYNTYNVDNMAVEYGNGTNLLAINSKLFTDIYHATYIDYANNTSTTGNIIQYIGNEIINANKNGKETAKILCSIRDYYDENDKLMVSPNKINLQINNIILTNDTSPLIGSNITIILPNATYHTTYIIVQLTNLLSSTFEIPKGSTSVTKSFLFDYSNPYVHSAYWYPNPNFKIGDEVIPKIPSPNGEIQMSKKADGTAKVFTVVGTNVFYDGAVWQELTLLEKA